MSVLTEPAAAGTIPAAGFLSGPLPTPDVDRLYAGDLEGSGYVARLTRLWAHSPAALDMLTDLLGLVVHEAGLTYRQRALLTSAAASARSDSYCSLAWGTKLAFAAGHRTAAEVLGGGSRLSTEDRVLVAWARKVARDPNSTTPSDVDRLRRLGLEDRQILALTIYLGLRVAFSTVNDALGAAPDAELADRAPQAVRDRVNFGRPPTPDEMITST
jgi:alkylhydroperoxidase family enzyme